MSKEFYSKCKEQGITDLKSKSNIARMVLLAENERMPEGEKELVEKYNEGKVLFEQEKSTIKDKKSKENIEKIKQEENLQIEEAKAYMNLVGRDKSISICEKKLYALKKRLEQIKKQEKEAFDANVAMGVAMYKAGEIKEKDWAIHGGIASGIGGAAAGLATALEIQQQNMLAREHNKQLMKSITQMQVGNLDSIYSTYDTTSVEKEIEKVQHEINNIKNRLVENLSSTDLMIEMNPKLLKQEFTETGAIKLIIQIHPISGLKIYDDIDAVVDGTFKALLIDENKIVGEAYFALPYGGITMKGTMTGYCVDYQTVKKEYDVIFVPINLWAIETNNPVNEDENCTLSQEEKNNIINNYVLKLLKIDNISVEYCENAIKILETNSLSDTTNELRNKCVRKIEELNINAKEFKKIHEKQMASSLDKSIAMGNDYIVGLKRDGSIVSIGNNSCKQRNVEVWTNIISLSIGFNHTVGLKSDGTVVATGNNQHGKCEVFDWTDIIAISAGGSHTVGLKSDGTVIATNYSGDKQYYQNQCEVSHWDNIVAISAGSRHTVGLKSDGTVIATKSVSDGVYTKYHGQCDVSHWTDIIAISAGSGHTVGLKADGTVVSTVYTGDQFDNCGQCDVGGWTDIIAISAGDFHTAGLKSDGTVVVTSLGEKRTNKRHNEVENWKNIVAIDVKSLYTIGLKSDGTVVDTQASSCSAENWRNIAILNTAELKEELLKQHQITTYRSNGVCQYCGGKFKGLFSKTCINCGKKKDY